MKNQLISDEMRKDHLKNMGKPYPEARCSGRSIGSVLGMIAEAMAKPGKWIKGRDHWTSANQRVKDSNVRLAQVFVRRLELRFFEFRRSEFRYNIFGED